MDQDLDDMPSTRDLFVRLEALAPAQAARRARVALPAIVAVGDFVLAERYLPRAPLAALGVLNAQASNGPLFPQAGTAPRLAAELHNFIKNIALCSTTFAGLGRAVEAQALREAALAGLEDATMRLWAQRELESPGAIMGELSARRMAEENAESLAEGAADEAPEDAVNAPTDPGAYDRSGAGGAGAHPPPSPSPENGDPAGTV